MRYFKILFLVALIPLILMIVLVSDIIIFPISYDKLDPVQSFTVDRINHKWSDYSSSIPEEQEKIISYDSLLAQLNFIERRFVKRILEINPQNLGFYGPYIPTNPIENLTTIPARKVSLRKGVYDTGTNYLPENIRSDYEQMMQAMERDLGKRIYIDFAYRSRGFQTKLFFEYLANQHNYSLAENAKWVIIPGYSEHGSSNTAIDFINQNGISGKVAVGQTPQDFENIPEFQWLMANAGRFNFYLSYPRGNSLGMNYEPWHWHWEKK